MAAYVLLLFGVHLIAFKIVEALRVSRDLKDHLEQYCYFEAEEAEASNGSVTC